MLSDVTLMLIWKRLMGEGKAPGVDEIAISIPHDEENLVFPLSPFEDQVGKQTRLP